MKRYSDVWHSADRALQTPLKPYHVSTDMGASRYEYGDRSVTIKHRPRKDEAAVVSLGCWVKTEPMVAKRWLKTVAMPESVEQAARIGQALLGYLQAGTIPEDLGLETYPGYENQPVFRRIVTPPESEPPAT